MCAKRSLGDSSSGGNMSHNMYYHVGVAKMNVSPLFGGRIELGARVSSCHQC